MRILGYTLALWLTRGGKIPRNFNRKSHLTPRNRLQFSICRKPLKTMYDAVIEKPLSNQLYSLFMIAQLGWLFWWCKLKIFYLFLIFSEVHFVCYWNNLKILSHLFHLIVSELLRTWFSWDQRFTYFWWKFLFPPDLTLYIWSHR